jgi:hypothetical protein
MLVRCFDFTDARLIKVDEVKTYLEYWIDLISGTKPSAHSPAFFVLLLNYIQQYGFKKAGNLIGTFGLITPPSTIQ